MHVHTPREVRTKIALKEVHYCSWTMVSFDSSYRHGDFALGIQPNHLRLIYRKNMKEWIWEFELVLDLHKTS